MIEIVSDAAPPSLAAYDEIIDVRSPAEFAEDHVPGAINLPVLSNEERAEIGTIYVQRSKFLARRLGAAYVSRNIASHLIGPLADKGGGYHPLIYCWRGGQRSNAMATVLSQVGWRAGLLQGGYKTYRRRVTHALYDAELPLTFILLSGGTGSGKTALLGVLKRRRVQVLDLEALAAHRGSLFGAYGAQAQPSQKMFESCLLTTFDAFDPAKPILIEAESSRIGDIFLPPALWRLMSNARTIELSAPVLARARHVVESCADIANNPAALSNALARLPRHHSRAQRETWSLMARDGQYVPLATELIEAHYDPAYERSSSDREGGVIGRLCLAEISPQALERAANAIQALETSGAMAPLTNPL